ncbi:probable purine permease 11 [Macadamia integrifolia]|uniref:probable purine permease 11 n=1 Tax=Macadamia integrifolia TaxID=60698 RepID=UPI001C4E8AD5|nr:probable purine permease 11 [Macadamia integrifolia]
MPGQQEIQEPHLLADRRATDQSPLRLRSWHWWILVSINVFFLIVGQTTAVLLGRFYYDQGGNSKWMATLVQTAAFPILFVPLIILSSQESSITPKTTISEQPSVTTLILVYVSLGVLLAGDNMMYSIGLLYLSASTYSLICASQLAFNAVFAFFINSQKLTALILNSVVVLTLSSALIGFHSDSTEPAGVSRGKYVLGFLCNLGASAIYSLLLSLMQLSFQKVLKSETFSVVLEMQIYTSLVATCCCIVGLFASGEWRSLKGEMDGFGKGRISYVLSLLWTAMAWQVSSVGVVGLIYVVSSLFSNVISTLALALGPVAAVLFFHDKMDGVKVVAMLMAFWGFASYLYEQYLDDSKLKSAQNNVNEVLNESTLERQLV